MINPKELRIGNYVIYVPSENEYSIIEELLEDTVGISEISGFEKTYDDLQPIPITEEWLGLLGFERYETEKSVNYKFGLFRFTFVGQGKSKGKHYLNYKLGMAGITFNNYCETNSIHQLQNLYYALCGEELVQVADGGGGKK